jgi:hypothetical protein
LKREDTKECTTNIFFGIFFDGTKNNYVQGSQAGNQSNVARLYDCFSGQSVPRVLPGTVEWATNKDSYKNFYRMYIPGVASPFIQIGDTGQGRDKDRGAAFGALGEDRIKWALIQAMNNTHRFFHNGTPLFQTTEIKSLLDSIELTKWQRWRVGDRHIRADDDREERGKHTRKVFEELLQRSHKQVEMHSSAAILLAVSMVALLASCASVPTAKPKFLGASVRSINYSGKEVALSVVDPLNRSNHGGGDSLNPYSMGGTICCFGIPPEWHPGYQVIVEYNLYPDQTWHKQLVDVPPYPEGIAGDIWLTMHEDGRAEAVVSNFGPTRPEWPGRVKGFPVPSESYIAKVRADRLNTQKGMLAAMENALKNEAAKADAEEVEELKKAIEETKKRIRLMQENTP